MSSPLPWRRISGSSSVQRTTVDTSSVPMPPSMTRSTMSPNASSMSSGGSHDGCVQLPGYLAQQRMVGHTDAHFLSLSRAEHLGQAAQPRQNEGERPRQVALHQLEYGRRDARVFADGAEVVADDGQVAFGRVQLLELANAFDGALLERVTADGVHRVRGVDDDAPVVEDVHDAPHVARVVVLGVEFQQHGRQKFFSAV